MQCILEQFPTKLRFFAAESIYTAQSIINLFKQNITLDKKNLLLYYLTKFRKVYSIFNRLK